MRTLALAIIFTCALPAFSAEHLISRTLAPSVKLVALGTKRAILGATFPLRHPRKDFHAARRTAHAGYVATRATLNFIF